MLRDVPPSLSLAKTFQEYNESATIPPCTTLDRRETIAGGPSAAPESEAWSGKPGTPADSGPLEGRYDLEARLGGGGMGEVWRARDRRLNRPVAIKRLNGDWARHPKAPEDPDRRHQTIGEFRAALAEVGSSLAKPERAR